MLVQIDANQNNLQQDAIPINDEYIHDEYIPRMTRPLLQTSYLSDSLHSFGHVSLSSLDSEGKG